VGKRADQGFSAGVIAWFLQGQVRLAVDQEEPCRRQVPRTRRSKAAVLFDLQVHQRDEWIVLSVVGEVDLAVAPRLRQAVIEALTPSNQASAEPSPASLVLDLGAVDFLDSSGLGVVLGALKRVRSLGGRLRVVVREPQVRRVFEITDLDRIISLADSVDDAIAMVPDATDQAVRRG
jgi:anti-sigma B factor antagonist